MALGFIVFSHVDGHAPPPMEPREGYQSVNAYLSSFTLLIYGFRVRDTQALVQRGRRPRRERAARASEKVSARVGSKDPWFFFSFGLWGLGLFKLRGLGPILGF